MPCNGNGGHLAWPCLVTVTLRFALVAMHPSLLHHILHGLLNAPPLMVYARVDNKSDLQKAMCMAVSSKKVEGQVDAGETDGENERRGELNEDRGRGSGGECKRVRTHERKRELARERERTQIRD